MDKCIKSRKPQGFATRIGELSSRSSFVLEMLETVLAQAAK